MNAVGGVPIGERRERPGKPVVRIEAGDLAVLNERGDDRPVVAAFVGAWGWGYDGVDLWSPHPAYGSPDDLKALVADMIAQGTLERALAGAAGAAALGTRSGSHSALASAGVQKPVLQHSP